jgi:hypothetical protein
MVFVRSMYKQGSSTTYPLQRLFTHSLTSRFPRCALLALLGATAVVVAARPRPPLPAFTRSYLVYTAHRSVLARTELLLGTLPRQVQITAAYGVLPFIIEPLDMDNQDGQLPFLTISYILDKQGIMAYLAAWYAACIYACLPFV